MAATEAPRDSATRSKSAYRLHWHILMTHFPISAFLGAFLFMALHLITGNACYPLAAYVSLLAGAVVMVPTTVTGWLEWKSGYKGFKNTLFRVKIWTSAVMTPLSVALVIYQATHPFATLDVTHRLAHAAYFGGILVLMAGAVIEGYWGARLHHR